jgi:Beta protein
VFNHMHYVPILKAKDGEFGALSELPREVKKRMTPLIDVFKNEGSGKELDSRLNKIADKVEKTWGKRRPIFIDLYGIDLEERITGGGHPLDFIFNSLRNRDVQAMPTIGLDRDDAYNKAAKKILKMDGRGLCIRLLRDDMENLEELEDSLDSVLGYLNITCKDTHMLLDFRDVRSDEIREVTNTAVEVIRNLPNVNEWCTLTIAASGFPGSLSEVGTHAVGSLPRTELQVWNALMRKRRDIARLPSFADYGVQHPDLLNLDWTVIPLVPNIRYTLSSEWLILRGGSNKKYGWHQTHQLSTQLMGMSEYYGESYCWGDSYIANCANDLVGPGNMTTWRKVGTNHHLTLVSAQIANAGVS